jgi:hypothetical protein
MFLSIFLRFFRISFTFIVVYKACKDIRLSDLQDDASLIKSCPFRYEKMINKISVGILERFMTKMRNNSENHAKITKKGLIMELLLLVVNSRMTK